jgi:hypothetical protein
MRNEDLDLYSAMQSGKPYKTYKKVVLGRVYVSAIDPFTEQPTGIMLYGDPKRTDESCFIDMWNERDDLFFTKQNKSHLASGFIVEIVRPAPTVKELTIEQYNDEQLREVVNMKFLALQAKLNKTSSEAVLYRMLSLAEEMDKSVKIVGAIQARLSEVNTIQVSENKEEPESKKK